MNTSKKVHNFLFLSYQGIIVLQTLLQIVQGIYTQSSLSELDEEEVDDDDDASPFPFLSAGAV